MFKGNSLMRREVLPFVGQFTLLVAASLMGSEALRLFDLLWIGRFLGIPGTLLIILSLVYSLRKRKMITLGSPKSYLWLHETLTWLGSLLVLVHAGVHINAVLPWLALTGMVFNVLSGMVGRSLLERSRRHLMEMEETHRSRGLSKAEVEREVFWDAVTYDLMAKWRVVHFPLSYAFAALTLAHILTILAFWEWR
ncbi:MAG: hypothetical protein A2516_01320 [Alphaproteobacteria bacterium RIFOXYD12_FULL_60_8]|nr:MAG: hypothetical protein A2516_01320 [Alphaproteobacteria bacterium RIFOXYD12_FULL_60_8]